MGDSDKIRELEQRLRAVESVLEIQNLKARYAALVDQRYGKGGVRPREEIEPLDLLFDEPGARSEAVEVLHREVSPERSRSFGGPWLGHEL